MVGQMGERSDGGAELRAKVRTVGCHGGRSPSLARGGGCGNPSALSGGGGRKACGWEQGWWARKLDTHFSLQESLYSEFLQQAGIYFHN